VKRILFAIAPAVAFLCACRSDIFFGKVEGVAATVSAANEQTPVYDARVTIEDLEPGGYVAATHTDPWGSFAFPDAPDATYRISAVSANGLFSTYYHAEVLDEHSPGEVDAAMAPTRAETFALVPGRYDALNALMNELGYPFQTFDAATLAEDPNPLVGYDLLLLNSGADTSSASDPAVVANLRAFVEAGGRLIATDRAWPFIAAGWPDAATWGTNPGVGLDGQKINADIVDADLKRAAAANRWEVTYDQPGWALPTAQTGTVFVQGDVETYAGARTDAPLLFGFTSGKGYVAYATFGWNTQFYEDRMAVRVFHYLIANR
jgi:hypothetical protein